jgi:hypothetical protein
MEWTRAVGRKFHSLQLELPVRIETNSDQKGNDPFYSSIHIGSHGRFDTVFAAGAMLG